MLRLTLLLTLRPHTFCSTEKTFPSSFIWHLGNVWICTRQNKPTNTMCGGLNRSPQKVPSSHRTAAALRWCRPSSAPGCGPVSCSTATSGRDGRASAPVPECVRSRGRSPWTGCVPCARLASTSPPCRSGPPRGEAGRREPEFLLRVKREGNRESLYWTVISCKSTNTTM